MAPAKPLSDYGIRPHHFKLMSKKIAIAGPDECWPWTGQLHQITGYPIFSVGSRNPYRLFVKRLVYAAAYGIDPYPYEVMHSCHNALCCNPAHLSRGTTRVNSQDRSNAEATRTAPSMRSQAKAKAEQIRQLAELEERKLSSKASGSA